GAAREPQVPAARARRRLGHLRERARRRARGAFGALRRGRRPGGRRPRGDGRAQQREARTPARRARRPPRALHLRGRARAPSRRPRAADRRRPLGRRDRRGPARRERLRLRSAFLAARPRQDGRRARTGAEEPAQPPREGAAPADCAAAGGRVTTVAAVASPAGIRLQALPPLALYVHLPWCVRKCPYCDFNSHEPGRGAMPIAMPGTGASPASPALPAELESEYVRALVQDLESALPEVWGRRVHSVFFGGGTPSLFSAESIDALLSAFRARLALAPGCEVTLEANPGTFEAAKFRGYRDAGVNRLSIGVQSFDPGALRALGRIHGAQEARRAIDIARASFENVNLDLMYALPEQTLERASADVDEAIAARAAHLSFYHLTLEPNTVFHRRPPPLPDDDSAALIQDLIAERLAAAGYVNYETSAWALPGRECRHNLNYWSFGDYVGIGAGAHSKVSFPERVVRSMRVKQP